MSDQNQKQQFLNQIIFPDDRELVGDYAELIQRFVNLFKKNMNKNDIGSKYELKQTYGDGEQKPQVQMQLSGASIDMV